MKYNKIQKARKKYLKAEVLSSVEQTLIENDLTGKDFIFYNARKNTSILLPDNYSAYSTYQKIEAGIRNNNRTRILQYAGSVAAMAIIAFLSVYIIQSVNQPALLVMETSFGEKKEINLPDGSVITLNSRSFVEYPKEFQGKNREIKLSGEAYFEVARDTQKPFIVKTGKIDIRVLGTQFNIKAYENEEYICTDLYQGSVSVSVPDGNVRILEPGNRAIYDKNNASLRIIESAEIDNNILWMKNILSFENTPLKEILSSLEREKNVIFNPVDPTLRELKITARFIHNETVKEILEILGQSAHFSYTQNGNIFTILPAD